MSRRTIRKSASVLLCAAGGLRRGAEPSVQEHGDDIDAIENDIPLLRSFNYMLDAELAIEAPKATLSDLMVEYGVPGVGIAEIDGHELAWVKRYGLGAFTLGEGDASYFLHRGTNDPGARSLQIANPLNGQGAVVMTNGTNGMQLYIQLVAVISLVYDWPHHSHVRRK